MVSYHGTSPSYITDLVNGMIDVTLGGGELGQGFYTGQHDFEAYAWAYNKHNRSESVLKIDVPDDEIEKLDMIYLDRLKATRLRGYIRRQSLTRVYSIGADMIWAPIVGTTKDRGDQYKWETTTSERLLNGYMSTRQ